MSSKILKFFHVPFSMALLSLGVGTKATDLAEVYALAVQNDHTFKAATAEYLANSEAKFAGRAGLLPSISASASWQDSETDIDRTLRQPGIPVVIPIEGTSEDTSTGYGLTITQTLFNMSAWNSFKAGAANADAAEAQYRSTQQALIIRSAQAYFDALLAASNFETSTAQENALQQQLEQTKQRFDVGLSAITEVHEAQAAYDSSVAERLIAEGQLGIAFEAIEVLTGKPFNSLSSLNSEFNATGPMPAQREEWVNRALENNFGLAAAKKAADALEFDAKAARDGHLPTLTLTGSYQNNDSESFVSEDNFNNGVTDTVSLQVNLNVPLYNGGSISSRRRQAKHLAIQARENYLQLRRDTVQNARTQHLNVVTGISTVKARAQAIISRQSALEATQAGYRVGTRDLVDVLNAQQTLYQAQRDYNTAVFEYIISSLNLKEVAGQLTEDDILALNSWLDANNPVERGGS